MFVKQIQKYFNYLMYPLSPAAEDLIKELCQADLIIEDLTKSRGSHGSQVSLIIIQ